ncbi:MAG: hypothetical protein KDK39_12345 [Leptospiraceae bacterium]|nr:hypothetical protein [Leptospiraceae bacterium]
MIHCRRAMLLLLYTLLASACARWADRTNAAAAEQDVRQVLAAQAITIRAIECTMIAGSRAFTCALSMSPADVKRMQSSFQLLPGLTGDTGFEYHELAGCETLDVFRHTTTIRTYRPLAPHQQRLPALQNFTHLRFWYRPDLQRGCLRSAYGYG